MHPAKFRLASVLLLRANAEDQARTRLGDAVRAREFAQATLAAARTELEDNTDAYGEHRCTTGFAAASHARHWSALQEGQVRCRLLESKIVEARKVEAVAQAALVEARRAHEMVLKLRERHHEEQRLEGLRHDEHALADFFNANLIRRARAAAQLAGA